MGAIYIFSEDAKHAAKLISFLRGAGKPVCAVTSGISQAKELSCYGAEKVYALPEGVMPEACASGLAAFLKESSAELFLAASTVTGRELAASVAGYAGCGMLSDVSELRFMDGCVEADRIIYGGSVLETDSLSGFGVVTINPAKYTEVPAEISPVETLALQTERRIRVRKEEPIVRESVNLATAKRIVSVGMGLAKKEDMQLMYDLAAVLGAEIGCSRNVAELRCWLPLERYVGLTGVAVQPDVYLAVGISGQVQHVAGIRGSKLIVAVNNNENAPIFMAADYGIVGDLYKVVPLIIEALKQV